MSIHTTGIDLDYRPASYFWAAERGITLLSDIKGAERRKLYARALEAGQGAAVPGELFADALTEEDRQGLGRIHPAFMGGEYLPDRSQQEVEIARITIASTTQDVTCVYARQVGERIHYRVVDEYEGMTLDEPVTRTSTRPLKLKELVAFFLKSWNLIGCLDVNFEGHGHHRDDVQGFIVDASSSFYAEFDDLVRARVDEWLDTLERVEEDDDEDDEEEF
jgi:hypothetical protein